LLSAFLGFLHRLVKDQCAFLRTGLSFVTSVRMSGTGVRTSGIAGKTYVTAERMFEIVEKTLSTPDETAALWTGGRMCATAGKRSVIVERMYWIAGKTYATGLKTKSTAIRDSPTECAGSCLRRELW
jgi:hypothetical protein